MKTQTPHGPLAQRKRDLLCGTLRKTSYGFRVPPGGSERLSSEVPANIRRPQLRVACVILERQNMGAFRVLGDSHVGQH